MRDRREEILARLPEIISAIPGIARTVRNQKDITGRTGAAVVVTDGDESAVLDDNENSNPRKPIMIDMIPGISIRLGEPSSVIGATANNLRALIIYAVQTDATLQGIVGSNGFIKYQGLTNELDRGQTTNAEYTVNIRIRYPLFIAELS